MFGKKVARFVILLCVLFTASEVLADLTNAGFEDPLASPWSVNNGGIVNRLPDAFGNHYALFSEPQGPGAPASSSLFQTFDLEPGQASLSFEYFLLSNGVFLGSNVLPDAFTVRLLDPLTLAPMLSTPNLSSYFYNDTRGFADSILYDDGMVTLSSAAARPDWFTVTLDLSSIPASTASARLQFDLFGTGLSDGQTTYAGVDNISTTVEVIPAPPAMFLGLLGLTGTALLRRTRFFN
jgi:hypothetical protein